MMTMEPASIYQLLKGPRVAVQKYIDNPNPRNPTNSNDSKSNELISENSNTCCDLCDVDLTTTPSEGGPRHLSSQEQEGLTDLFRRNEGRNSAFFMLFTLCPSCGDGMGSLLSLGRRVRRMEEELRDKIQTLLNIMRWKERRKGLCDPGWLEPKGKQEVVLIERPPDPDDEDMDGSIKGEFEDPFSNYAEDDGDLEYTDDDNGDDDEENDVFLRREEVEDITTPSCIDQAMNPIEKLQDLEFSDEEEIEEVTQSKYISDGAGVRIPVVIRPLEEDDPTPNHYGYSRAVDNSNYTSWEEADVKKESGDLMVPIMDVEDMDMEEMENTNADQQFEEGYQHQVGDSHDKELTMTMPQCNNDKELECSRSQSSPPRLRSLERKSKTTAMQKLKGHSSPKISSEWEGDSDQGNDGEEEGISTCSRSGSDPDCESDADAGTIVEDKTTSGRKGTKPRWCIPCNKKFRDLYAYRRHTFALTHKENVSKNNEEDEGELMSELQEHNDLLSKEGPPFLCACGKSFERKPDRDTHYHFGKCEIKCKACKKRFSTKTERDQHSLNCGRKVNLKQKNTTKDKEGPPFICICGKSFSAKHRKDFHFRIVHLKKDVPQCISCAKTFATTKSLQYHFTSIIHKNKVMNEEGVETLPNDDPKHVCETCGKAFYNSEGFRYHQNNAHIVERNEVCETCEKKFTNKNALKRHMQGHIRPHVCDRCGKRFREQYRLRAHILGVHEADNVPRINCPHCEKTFRKKERLRIHINQLHGPLGEEGRFFCLECNVKFKTVQERILHERSTHKGLKNFKCDYCDKTFPLKLFLETHMVGHTGIKLDRYTCSKCGKKFRNSDKFRIHRILICGDDEEAKKAYQLRRAARQRKLRAKKLYKCTECGVGYGQKAQLIAHRKREHGME